MIDTRLSDSWVTTFTDCQDSSVVFVSWLLQCDCKNDVAEGGRPDEVTGKQLEWDAAARLALQTTWPRRLSPAAHGSHLLSLLVPTSVQCSTNASIYVCYCQLLFNCQARSAKYLLGNHCRLQAQCPSDMPVSGDIVLVKQTVVSFVWRLVVVLWFRWRDILCQWLCWSVLVLERCVISCWNLSGEFASCD